MPGGEPFCLPSLRPLSEFCSAGSLWIRLLLTSGRLFGYGHYYKGPSGIVDSGMAGLILGAAFLLSGRNLWVCILAHGFIDTFAIVALYFGWSS
ncbi:MAG: hypothetical protein DMG98_16980 [Acidobacteria bacterium]|nr:MAG: hypothetical protein DMG98_16980 [Acidobacteriota bacterium]